MNADLNAAFNHIKVGFKEHAQQMTEDILSHKGYLTKFCNPMKLKNKVDNHQIVDIRKAIRHYLSNVAIQY